MSHQESSVSLALKNRSLSCTLAVGFILSANSKGFLWRLKCAATVQQIEEENTLLINDLYRLLKKYANLRLVVHTLHLSYRAARMYPIFPRYNMLKDMIKDVLRDPSYMEVCHEES